MKEKPSYYAIIPSNVRYSNLKPNAKLLYGEITALSNKLGYCFASNSYFAELYGVSKNTVSRWLSDLKKLGFITIKIERNDNKEIVKRIIGIVQKADRSNDKKVKGNTTRINTTSNNISIKEKFIDKVMNYDYPKDMLDDFINYWCEGKNKMRWQKQGTFEIKLRLLRWAKNQKKWERPKQAMSKLDSQINEWQKAKDLIK
jgi:DNA-binding transcriptional regulator YhcF (GntR family)|tara:strand:+ start:1593 stop:2195 length:603 start_codon:yes stop_codon:yes gene_type:complete